jgi:hypothetical protein
MIKSEDSEEKGNIPDYDTFNANRALRKKLLAATSGRNRTAPPASSGRNRLKTLKASDDFAGNFDFNDRMPSPSKKLVLSVKRRLKLPPVPDVLPELPLILKLTKPKQKSKIPAPVPVSAPISKTAVMKALGARGRRSVLESPKLKIQVPLVITPGRKRRRDSDKAAEIAAVQQEEALKKGEKEREKGVVKGAKRGPKPFKPVVPLFDLTIATEEPRPKNRKKEVLESAQEVRGGRSGRGSTLGIVPVTVPLTPKSLRRSQLPPPSFSTLSPFSGDVLRDDSLTAAIFQTFSGAGINSRGLRSAEGEGDFEGFSAVFSLAGLDLLCGAVEGKGRGKYRFHARSIPLYFQHHSSLDYLISRTLPELLLSTARLHSTGDWEVYGEDRLHILERRMQDILRGIESHEVPDDSTPSSSAVPSPVSSQPVTQRRSSRVDPVSNSGTGTGPRSGLSSSKGLSSNMRQLCQDFIEIPFETMPDYR